MNYIEFQNVTVEELYSLSELIWQMDKVAIDLNNELRITVEESNSVSKIVSLYQIHFHPGDVKKRYSPIMMNGFYGSDTQLWLLIRNKLGMTR